MKPKAKSPQLAEPIVYVGPPGTCETCIFSDTDCTEYGEFDCQKDLLAESNEDTGEEGNTVYTSS